MAMKKAKPRKNLVPTGLSLHALERMDSVKESIRKEKARRSLLAFTLYTKEDYQVNWHHKLICDEIDAFIADPKRTRLIVQVGPRRGKSEIISRRLPAYIFGKNPNTQIIATSYGADLASAMNRDVQRIIDSPKYYELFPSTRLSGKNVKTTSMGNYVRTSDRFEIVGYSGVYRSSGVGGGIKDWAEASSDKRRQLIKDWYSSTLYTRLSPNAKIIIVNTRWHEDDLAGYLIKEAEVNKEADQWEVISLPEIQDEHNEYPHPKDLRKNGEVLWPTRFTESIVAKIKHSVGSKIWSALFQQRPSPDGGQIIKGEWFQYYKDLPDIEYYVSSWDCAFKETATSDYVVGQVWGVCGSNKYLVYMVRERLDIVGTIREMVKTAQLFNLRFQVIEDKANGPAIISMLKNKVSGLIAFNPEGSKEARANAVAPQFEAGNIWLPDKYHAPNRLRFTTVIALLDAFVNEFKTFPNGANDDMVDATTQILLKIGHKVNWLDELIIMSNQKASRPTEFKHKVADVMGWNVEEDHTSIFDDMEEDMFKIDI
jgi:predicted phage terminase large subunit-like protein